MYSGIASFLSPRPRLLTSASPRSIVSVSGTINLLFPHTQSISIYYYQTMLVFIHVQIANNYYYQNIHVQIANNYYYQNIHVQIANNYYYQTMLVFRVIQENYLSELRIRRYLLYINTAIIIINVPFLLIIRNVYLRMSN